MNSMKKQKKPDSDSTAPQPITPVFSEKGFTSPGKSNNEMDADELVHQNRDEETVDAAFDVDEAVHKVKRNTNIEPGRKTLKQISVVTWALLLRWMQQKNTSRRFSISNAINNNDI